MIKVLWAAALEAVHSTQQILPASLPVFCSRLNTYLFEHCVTRNFCCCAHEVTLSFMDTLIALTYLLNILAVRRVVHNGTAQTGSIGKQLHSCGNGTLSPGST